MIVNLPFLSVMMEMPGVDGGVGGGFDFGGAVNRLSDGRWKLLVDCEL